MGHAGINERRELIFGFDVHVENIVGHVYQLKDFDLLTVLHILLYPNGHKNISLKVVNYFYLEHDVVQHSLVKLKNLLKAEVVA